MFVEGHCQKCLFSKLFRIRSDLILFLQAYATGTEKVNLILRQSIGFDENKGRGPGFAGASELLFFLKTLFAIAVSG